MPLEKIEMRQNHPGSTAIAGDSSIQVSLIFLAADALGVYLAFRLALEIRRLLIPALGGVVRLKPALSLAELGILLTILVFWLYHLYPGYGLTAVKELESLVKALTLVFVFLTISAYLLRIDEIKSFSRLTFLFTWVISILIIAIFRFVIRNRLSLTPFYGIPVMVVGLGTDGATQTLISSTRSCRRMGWRAQAVWLPDSEVGEQGWKVSRVYSKDDVDLVRKNIDVALVTMPATNEDADKNRLLLHWLSQRFKRVVLFHEISGLGSVWVETRDLEGWLGLEMQYHLLEPQAILVKRLVELVITVLAMIPLLPLSLLISIWVKLDSPGSVFYQQCRLGAGKRSFYVVKFRTMFMDADERLEALLEADPAARHEYEIHHKLKNDPRLTRAGKWLRKFSLDEVPQLWNVLRGEMNLVGPRAYMPEELAAVSSYADIILRVSPGMTGWWQVMGRHRTTFRERLQMDEYYVSNWSLWMDLFILMKTLWTVAAGSGA
jgi:Undecaprenyl-phosphate galactose phosphotransferase WbaP